MTSRLPRLSTFFFICLLLLSLPNSATAQVTDASRSGFTWITPNSSEQDTAYGAGYSFYSAVWPILKTYPGAENFQTGLASTWLSTRRKGTEPDDFYTTIEGGLGWWHDTRFGTAIPKFIMGGVSYNFYSWANGTGAGQTGLINGGYRDWSTGGGKYGVAQLSSNILWPPDGLNMAQGMNGQLLGYGYYPLPLTEPIEETAGTSVSTGNQCWTLFFNTENFKGPVTFFLPTFWTEPVVAEDPSLEGLFLDTRPSDQEIGFGIELAETPALVSTDDNDVQYAKVPPLQYPASSTNRSVLIDQIRVYTRGALWDDMENWFNGGPVVSPGLNAGEHLTYDFVNNGGAFVGEILPNGQGNWEDFEIDLESFTETFTENQQTMGFEWDLNQVTLENGLFVTPEYYRYGNDNRWYVVTPDEVPASTQLLDAEVPVLPRNELPYLTPLEPDCHWQDPNSPWRSPGPVAGPFYSDLGDGSTVTYYWYRFVDQPAIIHANLTDAQRATLQERVELIHTNWKHDQEYLAPPSTGTLTRVDPGLLVTPPAGLEIGYVPIVTRQEKSAAKVKVFVLAGQSNMQGFGSVTDFENDPGTLVDLIENDLSNQWDFLGSEGNWNTLENVWLHFPRPDDTIRAQVTVGQGTYSDLIGPELMFAYELDERYEEPILIIKTAWGGKSLGGDFRPPSASGPTGEYYNQMIETVQDVMDNLSTEFPNINLDSAEIAGFVWFQGWNDGESEAFLNEYESNLHHLVQDVRNDLGNPSLPIVIASSGHGGIELSNDLWVRDMQTKVAPAQEAVGCDDVQYGGTVGFVDTKPFFVEASQSPEDAIHHFNHNASTFLNIGAEIGKEMKLAIDDLAFCNPVVAVQDLEEVGIEVFPNPTTGLVTIQSRDEKVLRVQVLNAVGQEMNPWIQWNESNPEISIEGALGVYFLNLEMENGNRFSVKIVKVANRY